MFGDMALLTIGTVRCSSGADARPECRTHQVASGSGEWQLLGRILALLPMVYVVWWRRNIYIGMAVHCLGNTVTMLALLPAILA
jgi:hypothetical protein